MTQVWILVFMFYGRPMASGPHELEICQQMLESRVEAHCWNPRTQERQKWDGVVR